MKSDQLLEQERKVLHTLSKMPTRMLGVHERENLSAMLLHDLCGRNCFDLQKAAYLINNPDFRCLRGIVGFSKEEAYPFKSSIWSEPDEFSTHLTKAAFNNKVREVNHHHVTTDSSMIEGLKEIAENLHFENFNVASWRMPHDNFGIVMYEKANPADQVADKYLLDGLSLLSFCPLF